MTVLLTGATGELGQLVARRLRLEGKAVRVLTRRPYLATRSLSEGFTHVEWHPSVEPPPSSAFEGVKAVVHLMGEPVLGAADADRRERYVTSRVTALERIAKGMVGGQWRLIVVSRAPASELADGVITEATPRALTPSPIESALLAVETAAQAARSSGASVAIVRLGLLLTRGGVVRALAEDAMRGRLPNLSASKLPVIDPDDAAAMLTGLIDRQDIEGPVHGVAPEALDGRELMLALAAMSNWPLPWYVPQSRRSMSRRYGFLAPMLLNKARIVPQRLSDMGAQFAHPDPKVTMVRLLADIQRETAAAVPFWRQFHRRLASPKAVQTA